MAVNLSPVGGVAAQFFTNTGAVLTGGKLYTYAAGTTTPAVTYTSSNGSTPWTNPVVLDAAGRVPGSGEIWLTDGIIYKFVLKDSNDVLIATYDNITGINSNSVSYTNQQEIVTATAGQTVFNLGISYQPATNSLSVFVDGVNQYGPGAQYSYVETDSTTVTFNTGLHVGAEVKFTTTQQQGAGAVNASQVTYEPAGTGAIATTVQGKLRQTVSLTDFGADSTGLTDSTAAVQAAFDYVVTRGDVALNVSGTFLIDGTVSINKTSADRTPTYILGGGTFKKTNAGTMFNATNNATSEIFFNDIRFLGGASTIAFACNQEFIRGYFYNCSFYGFDVCFDSTAYLMQSFRIDGCDFGDIQSWVIDCGASGGYPIGSALDVHVSNCQIEGQDGGVFRGNAGLIVRDCVIENITVKPAFLFINTGSVTIADNYFEDCQQGVVVFDANANVSGTVISGNQVNLYSGTKFIVWGKTITGSVTIGNSVNGGQTNDTSQITSGYVQTLNDINVGLIADGSKAYKTPYQISGTFTPVVQGTTTAGTATYTRQDGVYTLIGNVVNFTMSVEWSGHTGTGNMIVSGLPIPPKNEYFALSALPGQSNGLTLPNGKVLTAGLIDGLPHAYVLTLPTDGSTGTYGFLSLASYTSGFVTISGSYLIN